MKVKLGLPIAVFDQLYEVLERSGRQRHIWANRDALALLLSDHSRLYSACKDGGVEIIDLPEQLRVDRSVPREMPDWRSAKLQNRNDRLRAELAHLKPNGGEIEKAKKKQTLKQKGADNEPCLFSKA